MEENIIHHPGGTIIMNGGNPLPGCPENWDQANKIIEKLNAGKGSGDPQWSFDCGYKLDFDGGLLRISSRFYPPKTHYGSTWDGTVSVYFMEDEVEKNKFDFNTLDELTTEVEKFVKTLIRKYRDKIFS